VNLCAVTPLSCLPFLSSTAPYSGIETDINTVHDLAVQFANNASSFVTDNNNYNAIIEEFKKFVDGFKIEFEKTHQYEKIPAELNAQFEINTVDSVQLIPLNAKDVFWNEIKEGFAIKALTYKTLADLLKSSGSDESLSDCFDSTNIRWCFDKDSTFQTNYTISDLDAFGININIK
jgi:hypothetical protein